MPIPYYTRAEIDMMLGGESDIRVIFYTDASPKPVSGTENILYVDRTNLKAEVWNPTTSEYEKITGEDLTYEKVIAALGFTPIEVETDPTVPQHVKNITQQDIDNWGAAVSWGNILDKPTTFPVSYTNSNTNTTTHEVAIIGGHSIQETVTALIQPTLTGNVLTLKFSNENGTEQSVTVDLSTLSTNEINVEDVTWDAATNILTVTETDGTPHSIDLSEFSITVTTDANGVSTLTQEGVTKITISKVGNTGQWTDILGKPVNLVQSITGDGVDNTDPANPVINIPYPTAVAYTGLDTRTVSITLSDESTVETTYDPKYQIVEHPDGNHNYTLRGYSNTFGADTNVQGDNMLFGYNHNVTKGWGNFLVGSWHDVIDGSNAFVAGYYNQVDKGAYGAFSAGAYNIVRTNYSAIVGYNNKDIHTPNGTSLPYPDGGNFVAGFNNTIAEGWGIGMFGAGHIQKGNNVVVVGQASANLNGTDKSVNVATDARFIVGNGTVAAGSYTRQTGSNAFVVYHSGLVVAPSITNALIAANAKALITKEYFDANVAGTGSGGTTSVSWADITSKPTTLAGFGITDGVRGVTGSAVDNTDPLNPIINIPSGGGSFWTKKTNANGSNYTLEHYSDTNNVGTEGGNLFLGTGNNMGNAFDNFVFARNTNASEYAWQNMIFGTGHTLVGSVRYFIGGEYNTVSNGAQDGMIMGSNSVSEIQLSGLFGIQLENRFNTGGVGDANFIQGRRNILNGGRYTTVLGEFHTVGDGTETVDGALIVGSGSDYDALPTAPSFLIGGGVINYSQHSLTSRANNFAVMKSGEVFAFQSDNAKIAAASGKVLITKEYLEANAGGGASASRFGIAGEDDTMTGNRTVSSNLNKFMFSNTNFEVNNSDMGMNVRKFIGNYEDKTRVLNSNGNETWIFQNYDEIYVQRNGAGDGTGHRELLINSTGMYFNVDGGSIKVPPNTGATDTMPISVNGIKADATGNIVVPIDGGSDPVRFGIEDNVTTENREVSIGAQNRIFFNTANTGSKFEVGSKIDINQWRDRLEIAKHTFNSYIRYSDNNSHTMISHSGRNINLEAYNYTSGKNFLLGLNTSGLWLENGNDTLFMPTDKGGYFPLTVNGVGADSTGNIPLTIPNGGVQGISGNIVDNTDPDNPVIDETITALVQPTLVGNILSIKYTNEAGTTQSLDVDLSSLNLTEINIEDVTWNASTNVLTVTETDGTPHTIDLSEFSISATTDANGVVTVVQEGVTKFTISKLGTTGQWADILGKPTLDNYQSWNLKTNGVQRTTVQSGGTLDIVGTGAAGVTYGAGGVVTINVPVVTPTDISKAVQVDKVQSFTAAEQKQGRDNILADKRSEVRIVAANPTNSDLVTWESDILLVKTARTITLPASGVLANGSRYLVKTTATGTVQFAAADGTVSIEYNDVNSTGYMVERSEAWILFQDNVYYVSGEVM